MMNNKLEMSNTSGVRAYRKKKMMNNKLEMSNTSAIKQYD